MVYNDVMKKINDGLTPQQRYRIKHLELCRERTRKNQFLLNNKNRFGGLRFKVLERDKFSCKKCFKNVSGKKQAVIHHKDHNKSNNTLRNLITLCHRCHAKHHVDDRIRNHKGIFI